MPVTPTGIWLLNICFLLLGYLLDLVACTHYSFCSSLYSAFCCVVGIAIYTPQNSILGIAEGRRGDEISVPSINSIL
ncbi:hypothetical protein V1509DRAFT_634691 [Lipomyces kononenkoae]